VIRIPVIVLALFASACQTEDDGGPRTMSAEDGISFARVDGWSARREQGTLILSSEQEGKDRVAIALRGVPKDGWSRPRTEKNVLPSVELVLRALPRARVEGPVDIDHPSYRAVEYDVRFKPNSRSAIHERRHVVIFADSRIIHLFMTGQTGTLEKSRPDFERVLASIREEG
jgi:hypothetical protein